MMAEDNLIEVSMGNMHTGCAPARLITRALGSCLGITFHHPAKKIGAMAHPMLPDIDKARMKSNPHRFVNSVIKKASKIWKSWAVQKRAWW